MGSHTRNRAPAPADPHPYGVFRDSCGISRTSSVPQASRTTEERRDDSEQHRRTACRSSRQPGTPHEQTQSSPPGTTRRTSRHSLATQHDPPHARAQPSPPNPALRTHGHSLAAQPGTLHARAHSCATSPVRGRATAILSKRNVPASQEAGTRNQIRIFRGQPPRTQASETNFLKTGPRIQSPETN